MILAVYGISLGFNDPSRTSVSTPSAPAERQSNDTYSPDNPAYSPVGVDPQAADDVSTALKARVYRELKRRMTASELDPDAFPTDDAWNAAQDRLDNQIFQAVADQHGITFRQAEDIWNEYETSGP